ncbi:MAG TPA: FecR family protein [bacterium]
MNQSFKIFKSIFLFVLTGTIFALTTGAYAQEEDLVLRAVDLRGHVMIYRDEDDSTVRLHQGQKADDGDQITTSSKSEVVLRLKGRAYIDLFPNSKISITRLRLGEKGVQIRLNLVKGRVLCQLGPKPPASCEVSTDTIVSRAHGTLFEVYRKKEEMEVVSYEGAVVTNSKGHVEMAKPRQVMHFTQGRFRYKHYLKLAEESRLEEWKNHLADIHKKVPNHP